MGLGRPKQYEVVAGRALIDWTLDAFRACSRIDRTYVVLAPDDRMFEWADEDVVPLYCGGVSRRDSVLAGLSAIREQAHDDDWVLVHDAARPGLTAERLNQLIGECEDDDVGGLLAMPVADTLKRVASQDADVPRVGATVDRTNLWAAQTPQMFRYALLVKALDAHPEATDEASAIEALGLSPRLVRGSMRNLKVTYPDDIALAATWLAARPGNDDHS